MSAQFFGQFLLKQGVVTAEQLARAISYQEKVNRKFGEVAVSLELLTDEQLGEMLDLQSHEDVPVGEAGMRLGIISAEDVQLILDRQARDNIRVGEALVITGALTREALEAWLKQFHAAQTTEPPPTPPTATGVDPIGLAAPLVEISRKLLGRMAGLRTKLEPDVRIAGAPLVEEHCGCRIAVRGEMSGEVAMRVPFTVGAHIASRMVGEPVSVSEREAISDACMEFLNLIAGRVAERFGAEGKKVEVGMPALLELAPAHPGTLWIRLVTPEGPLQFAVTGR